MEEKSNNSDKPAQDDDLNSLLDNALKDFDSPQKALDTKTSNSSEINSPSVSNPGMEEFFSVAGKQFEQHFKQLFEGNDEAFDFEKFQEQMQKMAGEASTLFAQEEDAPEFSAAITETLKSLNENSECLRSEIGADDISSMLNGLGLGGSEAGPDFLPLMQTMMSTFMSKDVLLPPIKEVVDKYPVWLEENKSTLSEKDYDNYSKQCKIMEKVCLEFEKETETDSDDLKKERFAKVIALMEDMQKYGHPPKELVGADTPFSLDDKTIPNTIPGLDPAQCSIM